MLMGKMMEMKHNERHINEKNMPWSAMFLYKTIPSIVKEGTLQYWRERHGICREAPVSRHELFLSFLTLPVLFCLPLAFIPYAGARTMWKVWTRNSKRKKFHQKILKDGRERHHFSWSLILGQLTHSKSGGSHCKIDTAQVFMCLIVTNTR